MIRILCAASLIFIPTSASAHVAPELGFFVPHHATRGSCERQAGDIRGNLGSQNTDYKVYCEQDPSNEFWVLHVHARD